MAFFDKIYTGKDQRPLTNREIKAYVMNARGITSEEYQRLYDRTRNKVRNYERYTGEKVGNVSNYLYKLELDKATGRAEWQARQKRLIEKAPTISTGANIEKVKKAYDPLIDQQIKEDMKEFIEADFKSRQAIAEGLSGLELKRFLEDRVKKVYAEKKRLKGGGGGGGFESPFDDTDYAFDYSEV